MCRVDRRTNALQTNQRTNQQTDTASYRGALAHLKIDSNEYQLLTVQKPLPLHLSERQVGMSVGNNDGMISEH